MTTPEKKLEQILLEIPGGVGSHLSKEEKNLIRDGMPNHAENEEPYDLEKMLEIGEEFMNKYPFDMFVK